MSGAVDSFSSSYSTEHIAPVFGDHWCGPAELEHGKWTLIATYAPGNNSDGLPARVHCTAWPADFYRVTVRARGKKRGGFVLSTGAGPGMAHLAHAIADAAARGMLAAVST